MKMWKQCAAIITAGALVVSLGACGKSAGEGGKEEGGVLTVSIWDNNQLPGVKEIVGDFTEKTGIQVEVQMVPWDQYWTLLEAGAQGGTLPDVFWMHSNYSQKFMSNDMLLDLTDKVANSDVIKMENYYEDIAELYQFNGKIYGIPKDYDTIGLWYNKTMFDEAGIDYPDETWTWDTMAEAAKKLTKEDGSQYGFASPASYNQDGYYNLIYSMGGSVLSEDKAKSCWDSPETIKAMNWWYDNLVKESMPSQQVMGENTADVLFSSGKSAMVMQGSWMVAAFRDNEYTAANCDVAVLPKAEDGTRISIYNGLGWAAAAGGSHTEEAWKLLEYLGSEEAQKKQAELGVTMSAFQGTSDTWTACAPDFNLQAFLDMADNMVIRPYTKNTKVWEDYSQEAMVKAYTGEMSMEDVCRDIAGYMNEQLAQEK
ncbi:MAG: sugar ABC transporter substrate-binding protein [Lachnospiraceae bacterium]|jgi:multiple sugar transport system substrate-binding protein|nr:sugar ABC transporter substrate-binding protein [Lachnospiraceae bacterium]